MPTIAWCGTRAGRDACGAPLAAARCRARSHFPTCTPLLLRPSIDPSRSRGRMRCARARWGACGRRRRRQARPRGERLAGALGAAPCCAGARAHRSSLPIAWGWVKCAASIPPVRCFRPVALPHTSRRAPSQEAAPAAALPLDLLELPRLRPSSAEGSQLGSQRLGSAGAGSGLLSPPLYTALQSPRPHPPAASSGRSAGTRGLRSCWLGASVRAFPTGQLSNASTPPCPTQALLPAAPGSQVLPAQCRPTS